MLVWPLPSAPWHLAHRASQFPLASEAEAVSVAVKPRTAANMIIFFIVVALFCWCATGAFSGSNVGEKAGNHYSCFGQRRTFFALPFRPAGRSSARGQPLRSSSDRGFVAGESSLKFTSPASRRADKP